MFHLCNNDYSSVIEIYFYKTFSTSSQNLLALVLNSLDTLSIPNPSLLAWLYYTLFFQCTS